MCFITQRQRQLIQTSIRLDSLRQVQLSSFQNHIKGNKSLLIPYIKHFVSLTPDLTQHRSGYLYTNYAQSVIQKF